MNGYCKGGRGSARMQTAARVWHACAVVHTSAALVRLSTDVVASVPITTHAQKGRPHMNNNMWMWDVEDVNEKE